MESLIGVDNGSFDMSRLIKYLTSEGSSYWPKYDWMLNKHKFWRSSL